MAHSTNARASTASGPIRGPLLAAAGLAAAALLAALAAGCDSRPGAIVLQSEADFNRIALKADKPALVMFFKGGCASCAALEPTFDELAREYEGRAVVAKFMLLTFVFEITSPDLHDRYGVVFVPHAVLLVKGRETGHWIMDYNIDTYRNALNAALASQPAPGAPAKPASPARPSQPPVPSGPTAPAKPPGPVGGPPPPRP